VSTARSEPDGTLKVTERSTALINFSGELI
jgi:hypothetical protein